MTVPAIGVFPPSAFADRQRLFQALSQALDVQFVATRAEQPSLSGFLYFEEEPKHVTEPSLVLGAGSGSPVDGSRIRLARSSHVDGHLRGWTIEDGTIHGASAVGGNESDTTLADVAGLPVWTTRSQSGVRVDHSSIVPQELDPTETLQSYFTSGRFFGLLPIVAFIRSLDGRDTWHRPPVRASFMMDDPNLHAATYGYVDYEKVVVDAQDLGFHLSVATIPLDGWFTSARTASIFRNHPRELSLLIHGNSHTKHELEDAESSVTPLQVLAQSIRRIQRFEQRSDVDVAQVMAAPHGRCSHESATAMARLGFESICITRPFPWLDRPPSEFPLAGWFPADTYSVMPTMGRVPLSVRPEEIALRAFLGQPIVLYGHESDLGVQPDLFSSWAEHVARLDDVPWASVKDISRGLVSWRTDGETLWVRPHTRMIEVAAPLGIERLIVEADGPGYETVTVTDGAGGSIAAPLSNGIAEMPVSGRPGKLTIRVQPGEVVDPDSIPAPRWSPWPLTRRMLTEARDRSRPRIDAWRRR